MSLPITESDIDQLIGALNRLSLALEASSTPSSSSTPATVVSIAGWELVEPTTEQPYKVSRI